MKFNKILNCRFCKSEKLESIVNLGNQYLTGIFPKNKKEKISKGPLVLVLCKECFLVQLKYSFNANEMYGKNYGYRSGLNNSMVEHLKKKIIRLQSIVKLKKNDLVIDIGSNDGTSLSFYKKNLIRVGIDPTAKYFEKYYSKGIRIFSNFFSSEIINKEFPDKKAKIITAIAMFYDLEDPLEFLNNIYNVLDDDGLFHFEQSYLPSMIKNLAFDTICHEHIEYYTLEVIKKILSKASMKIIDIEMNSINGGSIAITSAKKDSKIKPNTSLINWVLNQEKKLKLDSARTYFDFNKKIINFKDNLNKLLRILRKNKKRVFGYGASTKGNVILQYCRLNNKDLPFIVEINERKFGCYTPGSKIKIISEKQASKLKPNYLLILPWHFRENIIAREHQFLQNGGKLILPLPDLEIV
jgi:ubiquinone/menaquinone biosynthesis C-methylase UbiE